MLLVIKNKNKNTEPQTVAPADNTATQGVGQTGGTTSVGSEMPEGLPAQVITPLAAQKNGVQQLAKVFVERYGTYSTDNNFQNIKDVETLVTRSLWSKISAPISSKTVSQSFTGVTTKVISMDLTEWSDVKATVELKTSRIEEKNGVVTTRYQTAVVSMVKQNVVWLIDKISWN